MSRLIIVGSTGFLGSHVLKSCNQYAGIAAFGTTTKSQHQYNDNHSNLLTLDITKESDVNMSISKLEADFIINCAANTNVDECERRPELARSINAIGARNLAKVSKDMGIRLIHVSTDSVFDGKEGGYSENSEPNPINTYAKTKLEGESFVSQHANDYVIVRTNLYGLNPQGKHLLNWILLNLANGKEMLGFEDAVFNPLWTKDLAECLIELAINSSYTGILHCAADEIFSKYEFIKRVAEHLGYNNANIKKGSSTEVTSFVAKRPNKTYLSNLRMKELLKTKIHTLSEVMQDSSFDNYRAKAS